MIIIIDIVKTKKPNPFLRLFPSIKFVRYTPIKIPTIDKRVNTDRSYQSKIRFELPKSPRKPNKDLIAIINKEVATAFFIGSFANKTRAGIIKKPPPAPTIPVKIPTIKPSTIKAIEL